MRIGFIIQTLALVGYGSLTWAAEPGLGSADFAPVPQRPFGWRGDGTGRFADATPPLSWSVSKNVRWSTTVGSAYSSPILTRQLIFATAEPDRLLCLDRSNGKVRWQLQIKPADLVDAKSRQAAADYVLPKDGSGMMAATPVTDGNSIFVVLANGMVCAVSLDGKLRWTALIDAEPSTGYGRSASPLLVDGKLIVHMTNLYAFEAATGKQSWVNSDAPSKYGTPAAVQVGGTNLIVTPNGDVVRVADGKLAGSDLGTSTHTSPVTLDGVVYLGETAVSAVRFDAKFKGNEVWSATVGDEVFGSPLVHAGTLFLANGKGELYAYDATGKGDQRPRIEARPLFGKSDGMTPVVYASITLAGKYLFLNSNRGEMVILDATREAKEVARNRLPAGSGASPIFSGKEMFLRDGNKLFCVGP